MISKAKFNFTNAIKNNDPISRISLRSSHSSLVMKRRSNTFSTCLRIPPENELMRIDEAGKMIIKIILQDTISGSTASMLVEFLLTPEPKSSILAFLGVRSQV